MYRLLPESGNGFHYYRANLHCHTTVSDGHKTPEQVKDFYCALGYSIIAFTDHDVFVPHNDLTDDTFLALNGFEAAPTEGEGYKWMRDKTSHYCLIAKSREQREGVPLPKNGTPVQKINALIADAKRSNFYVTYNHPTWSMESYPDYMSYHGMDAMEILNYGSFNEGFEDDNGRVYDDLLRGGERLFCIAADDNHNIYPDESPMCDSGGGYIMIGAEKLDYPSVIRSLECGMFYTSTGTTTHRGPEILSLTYENRRVHIRTTPCQRLRLICDARACACLAAREGETVTEAEFDIREDVVWFRLTAVDDRGWKAYTNAYYPADMPVSI